MRSTLLLKILPVVFLLPACVTINVYFPAAAAEQAADKIIGEVWGPDSKSLAPGKPASPKSTPPNPTPPNPTNDEPSVPRSSLHHAAGMVRLAAVRALDVLVPAAAAAAEPDLNIATPAIRQLTQSMEARHGQIKQYYDAGALGLTANGLIEVRDLNAVPLAERTSVRKLISEENADRNNLYREIAAANGHPEWEADIRTTFGQRWIQRAASGWYYNDGSGWKQKS
jgi:uncharacterized protein YdbL (DUF1318 family)